MFFSIIIPLYNRPQEIDELLHTLTKQNYLQFEVLIIEDGSKIDAKVIVDSYTDRLDISDYFKYILILNVITKRISISK